MHSFKIIDIDALDRFKTNTDLSMQSYLSGKVDKENGKGLSSNDFTSADKTKLNGIAAGAEVNVIEAVKVNGTALPITNKTVNIQSGIQEIEAAAGAHINSSGTPTVTASTSGSKTTLTFDYLKGVKGDKGDTGATGAKGDKGDTGPQGPKGDTPTFSTETWTFIKTNGTTVTKTIPIV